MIQSKQSSPEGKEAAIALNLGPDHVLAELRTQETAQSAPKALFHRVEMKPGALVRVVNSGTDSCILDLEARGVPGQSDGWNPSWVRWSYAARVVSELEGGSAVSAHDQVAPDQSSLRLLALPGEERVARIEFDPIIDGHSEAGDYLYEVIARPTGKSDELSVTGLLHVRHRESGYMRFMPGIYQAVPPDAEPGEIPFLHRLLAGFEQINEPIQNAVAEMALNFGPFSAPSELVGWLSTWVGLVADDKWPEMKRRRLISEAVSLYAKRGTMAGLERYIEIFTGVKPVIKDRPVQGWRLGKSALLGRNTSIGDLPHHAFSVTLSVDDPALVPREAVISIIESERPAHTSYRLRILQRSAMEESQATDREVPPV